jgi:glycolate oxidase
MNSSLLTELRQIVGPRALITSHEELLTYDTDALTNVRVLPRAVLLPSSTEQVQSILRL